MPRGMAIAIRSTRFVRGDRYQGGATNDGGCTTVTQFSLFPRSIALLGNSASKRCVRTRPQLRETREVDLLRRGGVRGLQRGGSGTPPEDSKAGVYSEVMYRAVAAG